MKKYHYKFKTIVKNIKNICFRKIYKKILIVLLHQNRSRIYIGIIAYSTDLYNCTDQKVKFKPYRNKS